MLKDFIAGERCVFEGLKSFYGTPRLWRYAIFPLCIILPLYLAAVWGAVIFSVELANLTGGWTSRFPEYLRWMAVLIKGGVIVLSFSAILLFLLSVLSSIYEAVGELFWDKLVAALGKEKFGNLPAERFLKNSLQQNIKSIKYGSRTIVLFLLLFAGSFFLPFIGPLLLFAVMGYRFGTSTLFCGGSFYGKDVDDIRQLARENRWSVLGFGIAAHWLMLIPLGTLIFLPGIICGSLHFLQNSSAGKIGRTGRTE